VYLWIIAENAYDHECLLFPFQFLYGEFLFLSFVLCLCPHLSFLIILLAYIDHTVQVMLEG
jgi:hypothetical protein